MFSIGLMSGTLPGQGRTEIVALASHNDTERHGAFLCMNILQFCGVICVSSLSLRIGLYSDYCVVVPFRRKWRDPRLFPAKQPQTITGDVCIIVGMVQHGLYLSFVGLLTNLCYSQLEK